MQGEIKDFRKDKCGFGVSGGCWNLEIGERMQGLEFYFDSSLTLRVEKIRFWVPSPSLVTVFTLLPISMYPSWSLDTRTPATTGIHKVLEILIFSTQSLTARNLINQDSDFHKFLPTSSVRNSPVREKSKYSAG